MSQTSTNCSMCNLTFETFDQYFQHYLDVHEKKQQQEKKESKDVFVQTFVKDFQDKYRKRKMHEYLYPWLIKQVFNNLLKWHKMSPTELGEELSACFELTQSSNTNASIKITHQPHLDRKTLLNSTVTIQLENNLINVKRKSKMTFVELAEMFRQAFSEHADMLETLRLETSDSYELEAVTLLQTWVQQKFSGSTQNAYVVYMLEGFFGLNV